MWNSLVYTSTTKFDAILWCLYIETTCKLPETTSVINDFVCLHKTHINMSSSGLVTVMSGGMAGQMHGFEGDKNVTLY